MGNQYSYEDHPDGTNCLYKTACVTKYTSIAAFYAGSIDVICFSKPQTIQGVISRYPKFMVPGIASGVMFGMSTCLFTQMRGKDDLVNYWFGGMATGATLGVCRRSFNVGTPCAAILGLAAVLYKYGRQNNFVFFPVPTVMRGTWDSMEGDYTILVDKRNRSQ